MLASHPRSIPRCDVEPQRHGPQPCTRRGHLSPVLLSDPWVASSVRCRSSEVQQPTVSAPAASSPATPLYAAPLAASVVGGGRVERPRHPANGVGGSSGSRPASSGSRPARTGRRRVQNIPPWQQQQQEQQEPGDPRMASESYALKAAIANCVSFGQLQQLLPELLGQATPHLVTAALVRFAHLLEQPHDAHHRPGSSSSSSSSSATQVLSAQLDALTDADGNSSSSSSSGSGSGSGGRIQQEQQQQRNQQEQGSALSGPAAAGTGTASTSRQTNHQTRTLLDHTGSTAAAAAADGGAVPSEQDEGGGVARSEMQDIDAEAAAQQVWHQLHTLLVPLVPWLVWANCSALLWVWARARQHNRRAAAAARARRAPPLTAAAGADAAAAAAAAAAAVAAAEATAGASAADTAAAAAAAAEAIAGVAEEDRAAWVLLVPRPLVVGVVQQLVACHTYREEHGRAPQVGLQVARASWAAAVLRLQQPALWDKLLRVMGSAAAQQLLGPQELATCMWALAAAPAATAATAAAAAAAAAARSTSSQSSSLAGSTQSMSGFGDTSLTHSSSSGSSSSSREAVPVQAPPMDAWKVLLARVVQVQQQLSALDAATIAWAVAKVNRGFDRQLIHLLATLTSQQAHLLQPQELCLAALAHSRLLTTRYKRRWHSLRPCLALQLLTRSQLLQEGGLLSPQQCVVLAHSLTHISRMSREALGAAAAQQRQQQQQQQGRRLVREQQMDRDSRVSATTAAAAAAAAAMEAEEGVAPQTQLAGLPEASSEAVLLLREDVSTQQPLRTTWQNVERCACLTAAAAAAAAVESADKIQEGQQTVGTREQVMLAVTVVRLHEQRRLLDSPELVVASSSSSSSNSRPVLLRDGTCHAPVQQQLLEDVERALDAATAAVVRLLVRCGRLWLLPCTSQQQQQQQQQEVAVDNARNSKRLAPRDVCMLLWSLVTLLVPHTQAAVSSSHLTAASSPAKSHSISSSEGRLEDADVAAAFNLLRLALLPAAEGLGLGLKLSAQQLVLVARACGLLVTVGHTWQQHMDCPEAGIGTSTAASTPGSAEAGCVTVAAGRGAGAAVAAAGAAAAGTLRRLVLVLRAEVPTMELRELGHLVGAAAAAGVGDPDLLDEVAQAARRPSVMAGASACEVTRLVSGFAQLQHTDERLLAAAADALVPALPSAWLGTLATAAWGFASLGFPDPELFAASQRAAARKLPPSSPPHHLAALAWALATAEVQSSQPLLRKVAAVTLAQGVAEFSLQQVSALVWALSRCQCSSQQLLQAATVGVLSGMWPVTDLSAADAASTLACVLVTEASTVEQQQVVLQLAQQVHLVLRQQQQQQGVTSAADGLPGSSWGTGAGSLEAGVRSPASSRSAAEVAADAAWSLVHSGLFATPLSAPQLQGLGPANHTAGTGALAASASSSHTGVSSSSGGREYGSQGTSSSSTPSDPAAVGGRGGVLGVVQQLLVMVVGDVDELSPADLARTTWAAAAAAAATTTAAGSTAIQGGDAIAATTPAAAGGVAASILAALWSAVAGWGPSGFNAADALLLWQASCWAQLQQQGVPWLLQQLQLGAAPEGAAAAKPSKRGAKPTAVTAAPGSKGGQLRQLLPAKILQSGKRAAAAKAAAICGSPGASALKDYLQTCGLSAAPTLQPRRLTSKEVEALQPLQVLTHLWVYDQQEQPMALLVLLPPVPPLAPHQLHNQQQEEVTEKPHVVGSDGLVVSGAPGLLLQLLLGAGATRVSPAASDTYSRDRDAIPGSASGAGHVMGVLRAAGSPVVVLDGVVLPCAGPGLLEVLVVRLADSC